MAKSDTKTGELQWVQQLNKNLAAKRDAKLDPKLKRAKIDIGPKPSKQIVPKIHRPKIDPTDTPKRPLHTTGKIEPVEKPKVAKKLETLEQVFSKNRYELAALQKKSESWLLHQAYEMQKTLPGKANALLKGSKDLKSSNIVPGTMVLYKYDPKLKETLPYYDTFPLGIIIDYNADGSGFYSLNLHYLPYVLRARLLQKLMDFASDKKLSDKAKLNMSWSMLKAASKYDLVKPCIKQYLFDHVRSPFRKIQPKDWATAILLPVENFKKSSMQNVWADSLKKI